MKTLHLTALVLVVVGAINWGLIGIFEWNLVAAIFGTMEPLTRIVYVLVGIAGVVVASTATALRRPAHHHGGREYHAAG